MLKTHFRLLAAALVTASIGFSAIPARADGMGDVYQQIVLPGANSSIKAAMEEWKRKHQAQQHPAAGDTTVAQAPPVSQEPVSEQVGFAKGITYTADVSIANPMGNIGGYGHGWLMGGMDASINYSPAPTWRFTASLYELQHWPYGFNSGLAPVYLAGFKNPVGCADLSGGNGCGPGAGRNLNVRTKDRFGVFLASKMFFPLGHIGVPLPIVVSPTYVTRGGYVGEATGPNDIVPFAYNLPDGPVFNNLATRTAQFKSVAVTMPFLKTPVMFGTFTVAPQWLMHTAGVNSKNSMQIPQILYLEYTPTKTTTIWFEPQSARDYLPTDPYPEHVVAYFAGVSQRVTRYSFVQFVLNSGGPTNMGPDGVTGIKCLTVQQALNSACGVAIGGLRATQFQIQFGIGSPGVFPL